MAFMVCAWLSSRKLGGLVSASTGLAAFTFYVLLPYSKPANHPDFTFQFDYFLRAWLGGEWEGLALLCVIVVAVLLRRRQAIPKIYWTVILMPGLFSVAFAGMVTMSRSGFGLEQANSSRYVTHSLLLGLSALASLALFDGRNRGRHTPLLGGFLVIITTLGSLPQSLN